jgi:hypothetical protein
MTISRPLRASAPALALALVLGLGGCGTDETPPAGDTTPTPTTEDAAPTTDIAAPSRDDTPTTKEPSVTPNLPSDPSGAALPTGPVPTDVLEQDNVQAAVADLAKRESADEADVTVAGYHSVTWRDGSIGCPKPGMMYTQALVPGHLLVLKLEDQLYSYHSGGDGKFAYCANPVLPPLDESM